MLVLDTKRRILDVSTFKTPAVYNTRQEALEALENIRNNYSSQGWEEYGDGGYVARCANGKWFAVYNHAKYEYL